MNTYAVHGLVLGSELAFPELQPANGQSVDVSITLGPTGASRPEGVETENWFVATPDDTAIRWPTFGSVRVRGGREIRVEPNPDLDVRWLRAVIMGQLMTLILQQLGRVPLHASSVVIDGGAVAFAGSSGEGKSTLAAALVERGYAFLSDDVTALIVEGKTVRAHPGIPRQRLSREAVAGLGLPSQAFHDDPSDPTKSIRPMHESAYNTHLPLRAIVLLDSSGEGCRLETVSHRRAFTAIMEHVHRPELHEAALSGVEFMQRCASVVSAVPIVRLSRPRGLAHIAEAIRCLERELA